MLLWKLLSAAALVAASPIESLEHYTRAIEARDGVSQASFDNFKFYAQHATAAYCNPTVSRGDSIKCKGYCGDVERNAVYAVGSASGSRTGIAAYVAVDNNRREVVVSVRGSNNIRNFITDVIFAKKSCKFGSGCKMHTGFSDAWDEISSSVYSLVRTGLNENKGYRLVITGHSLGGAVAIIAAANLRADGYPCDLYTFGSPRVGNDVFANYMSGTRGAQFRITHARDPVPRLPPIIFGYRHTSPEIWLSTGGSDNTQFSLGDLKICAGIANIACNAGTFGLDIIAHLHYLGQTSGCAPFPIAGWKRDNSGNPNDPELEQRLNDWSTKDQAYASN